MHSNRMRTVRSNGRISGGCLLWGVCSWGVCSRGVSTPGGCLLQGLSAQGGSAPGGCLPRGVSALGVSAPGGVCLLQGVSTPAACTEAETPTPCGQTNACKNITFATSLRTVKTPDNRIGYLRAINNIIGNGLVWRI